MSLPDSCPLKAPFHKAAGGISLKPDSVYLLSAKTLQWRRGMCVHIQAQRKMSGKTHKIFNSAERSLVVIAL